MKNQDADKDARIINNGKFQRKMLSFRHLCYKNGYLFAAFLIPVILMGIAYISFGIYPFGGRSVLSLDLNAQYVSISTMCMT